MNYILNAYFVLLISSFLIKYVLIFTILFYFLSPFDEIKASKNQQQITRSLIIKCRWSLG